MIDQETIDAVKAYQIHMGASESKVMFEAGIGSNPANKWTKMLTKFYKNHDMIVKSHDFRTTSVTEYYKTTKDIVKTQ